MGEINGATTCDGGGDLVEDGRTTPTRIRISIKCVNFDFSYFCGLWGYQVWHCMGEQNHEWIGLVLNA